MTSAERAPDAQRGVVFPAGDDGARATTATNRGVLAAAAGAGRPPPAGGPPGPRARAARRPRGGARAGGGDWRRASVDAVRDVTAAGARSPAAALGIAAAGLEAVHAR